MICVVKLNVMIYLLAQIIQNFVLFSGIFNIWHEESQKIRRKTILIKFIEQYYVQPQIAQNVSQLTSLLSIIKIAENGDDKLRILF